MNTELKPVRVTVIVHSLTAVLMGWVSVRTDGLIALASGIVVLLVIGRLSEKIAGKKEIKFWVTNGVFIYLLIWFISWVYFFNLT